MAGNIGNVVALLARARESIDDARKSSRAASSNNDSAYLRFTGMKTWAESTLAALDRAQQFGEEALTVVLSIQSQTDHSDPIVLANQIRQSLEAVERMISNTRSILAAAETMDRLFSQNVLAVPANHFHLADNTAERYQRSM